ncbi:MAG: ABC transporter ATP-binding protein [Thermodesulfobacteriota bacterium]
MVFELQQISASRGGVPALAGIELALEPGRIHGILGPNGSGKTTLLDLMCRLLPPDAGAVRLEGRPIASYSRRELARTVSLVPQDYGISFPFTVEETVLMGRHPHLGPFSSPMRRDREKAEAAMEATGTLAFAGRPVTALSGGERQRVAFARMLAQDAPVMLLDEPTANLDVGHALDLMDLVAGLVESLGRTAVVVMQDLNLALRYCRSLVFLKQGRIRAQGPVRDVLVPRVLGDVFEKDALVRMEPELGVPQVLFR